MPVLILGENGTGKEQFARKIHRDSKRIGSFVAINSSSIPENLLESELFGYKKGAFTGANANKKGLFETANGGSVFLDEIGDLPLAMQAKLLRVLQEKEITPLGSEEKVSLDFRLICATNRDLLDMIGKKDFREDLYYRINALTIQLPPLRERKEDIPVLTDKFIVEANLRNGRNLCGIEKTALELLMGYPWPGNIRQLKNTIESAVILSNGNMIGIRDFSVEIINWDTERINFRISDFSTLDERIALYEKKLVTEALKICAGHRINTSKFLGIDRNKLNYLIRKYKL
jgi:Nif-specific regulatory protein